MNTRRFAIKGLIALAVVVALSMFFARTIQTITTTKIAIAKAQQGRLEQTIRLEANLVFPNSEPLIFPQATGYNVAVGRVYVRPGYRVAKGDVLFTAAILDYQEKKDKLSADYLAEAQKLSEEEIKNRKLRLKKSAQNERYEAMLRLQGELAEARAVALAAALVEGVSLPDDIALWPQAAAGGTEALRVAAQAAAAKQTETQAAIDSFFSSYNEKKVRVTPALFSFIAQRDGILKKMADIEAQMAVLEAARASFSEVRAPRDGYVVEVGVKEGEAYDGKKAAYQLDDPAKPPVLRADITSVKRAIDDGAKATVKYGSFEWQTTVAGTGVGSDGKRYVDLKLNEPDFQDYVSLSSLAMRGDALNIAISRRAGSSATLIPAGALHEDGGEAYIFTVNGGGWGGLMDTGMKVQKQAVTVVDRSDAMVALADELWDTEIAYREDHPLEDGDRVMEYIR